MGVLILATEHSSRLPLATEILAWDTLTDPAESKGLHINTDGHGIYMQDYGMHGMGWLSLRLKIAV